MILREDKPVVRYRPSELSVISVGKKALVLLDASGKETLTKPVERQFEYNGIIHFETEDAVYRPVHNG